MTISVGIRAFKSRLSHYLAKARAGQKIEITSDRKVIARVVGLPEEPVWANQHPAMWRLVQSGQATWSGEKPKFARIKLPGGDKTISEMVLEDRD